MPSNTGDYYVATDTTANNEGYAFSSGTSYTLKFDVSDDIISWYESEPEPKPKMLKKKKYR